MKKIYTFLVMVMMAMMSLSANAAMYIVGSNPFGNWNPGGGVAMTQGSDGLYTYTFDSPSSTLWFVFGDGLNSVWDTFNSTYRYGPTTGSDQPITIGQEVTTQRQGNGNGSYKITDLVVGTSYTVTFDLTNLKFKVEGATSSSTDATWTVAGTPTALFGTEWDVSNTDNDMVLNESTGLYEWSKKGVALTAGDVKFKVAKNHDWGTAYPASDYTTSVTGGTYDVLITFNATSTDVTCTITSTSGTGEDTTSTETNVYILGEVNGNSWAPNVGVQMTAGENNTYTADVTTDGANSGYSYFSFTKKLAGGASDWDGIASYRFGAVSDGDFLVTDDMMGQPLSLDADGTQNAFKIAAGSWHLLVDLTARTLTITSETTKQDTTTETLTDVYILGEVNGNGWATNVGVQMTAGENNTYTAAVTTDGANSGYSYFSFTHKLAEGAEDWDGISKYRFGAVSEGDFLVTDELLGQPLSLDADGTSNAFKIVAGSWNFVVDMAARTLTITGEATKKDTTTTETLTDVYILGEVNGNGWATNVGVQMTAGENNTFTADVTTDGANSGYSYFSFTRKLAEGAEDWDSIANYRFGAVSDGDFLVTDELLGTPLSLDADGTSNAFKIAAGSWHFVLDLDARTLIITGEGTPKTLLGDVNLDGKVDAADIACVTNIITGKEAAGTYGTRDDVNGDGRVDAGDISALVSIITSGSGTTPTTTDTHVYILGEVNGNGWDPSNGVEMSTTDNETFTATVTTAGENSGYSYFSFTKALASSSSDWASIASSRFGAVSDGDFLVSDDLLGTDIALNQDGTEVAFKIGAGTWNFVVNLTTRVLVITTAQ